MLGHGIIHIEDGDNFAGSTPIVWDYSESHRNPCIIKHRATVSMAGVAADSNIRQEVEPLLKQDQISWYSVSCNNEGSGLRPDIKKALQLHFLLQGSEIDMTQAQQASGEDEMLDALFPLCRFQEADYQTIQEYFERAKVILSMPKPSSFLEQATEHLFQYTYLSCFDAWNIWSGIA
jgi:hypothetical protein